MNQTAISNLSSYNGRINHLVQMLNYYSSTFARIPLSNLSDVGKTAATLISLILGYKTVAIFLENDNGQPELLVFKGGILAGDIYWKEQNIFPDHLWKNINSSQCLDIATFDQQVNADTAMGGIENIVLAVPIIGTQEPSEKKTGMVIATHPPDDFDADADLIILEIITDLISGAISNCLSHLLLQSVNRKLKNSDNDLKKTLLSLEKANNRMLTILDNTDNIICVIDVVNYKILYLNKFGRDLYGDVLGSTCWQVLQKGMSGPCNFCPNEKLIHDDVLAKTYACERFNTINNHWYLTTDRLLHWIDNSLAKIHIAIDITEQKRLKENLFQSSKMESIGTLAGGIAHDFNNILAAILGFSELAKRDLPPGSAAIEDIDQIITSGKRATALVQQILAFSRKTEQILEPLQPRLIVQEVLHMLRSTLPTTVEILDDIEPDCGTIMADSTKIHQVVLNLCTNAFQALKNENGTLLVTLSRQEKTAKDLKGNDNVSPGTFIVLSVSDTGQGIDPETLSHIFEPYFTTKEQGTRKGTGLGLAMVHGIINEYNGFIEVSSELGNGSTFRVFIPALEENTATLEKSEKEKPLLVGIERILMVDDEPLLVRLNTRILEDYGYTVTGVTDSMDALDKVRAEPKQFDLIVTDQTMPGLTGSELAQAVLQFAPDMPIIICTGHSAITSEKNAHLIGIKRYVYKPVQGDELVRTVRMVLDETRKI